MTLVEKTAAGPLKAEFCSSILTQYRFMYVLPVISANTSFAHDSIYIVLTGGFNTLCDMPANTVFNVLQLHMMIA